MKKILTFLSLSLAILAVSCNNEEAAPSEIKVTKVEILTPTLNLAPQATQTLVAIVTPDNATNPELEWTSSNSTVALVTGGVVVAVNPGTAFITAKSTDGSNKSANCVVTVQTPDPGKVYVQSITLVPSTLSLTVGGNQSVAATVLPENATDKSLTWTSANPAVATVVNGSVTGIAAGTANILVAANDGSGVSSFCTVTVAGSGPGDVKVSSITLNPATVTLAVGGSQTIAATVLPENATNKSLTWNSSVPSSVSVANGVVTALAAGTSVVSATALDGSGVSAQCVVTVSAGPGPTPGETQVNLAQATIKTNAPMMYRTFWRGCDANGMGGDYNWCNWFWESGKHEECPVSSDAELKNNRKTNYDNTANLYDNNPQTSFHTNTDWANVGDATWGGGVPNGEANYGSHFIQVTLPVSAKQLKIQVTNDNCPAETEHTNVIGSEGVNIYVRVNGSYTKLGNFQVNGAGTTATFENIASGGQFIDEIRFERNCDPGWIYTYNNFGFSEMKIWTIGETGTAGAPSEVNEITPDPHSPFPVTRPSAPAGYTEINLASCEFSTNNPMQYSVYGPYASEGWGQPVAINPQQKANRKDMFDKVTNMWDGDAATSYHTNFDIWSLDYKPRVGAFKELNHIDVKLPGTYSNFQIWICNPVNGNFMGVVGNVDDGDPMRHHAFVTFQFSTDGQGWGEVPPYYDAADYNPESNYGTSCLFDGYGMGIQAGSASWIRIMPHVGETSSGTTFDVGGETISMAGNFGIAELAIFAK